ncbi:MAG: extracellular solute-binding protein, partial [Clostridia bacterium]|nr:extracellular solute-binding protein [Clostridia bacterium]
CLLEDGGVVFQDYTNSSIANPIWELVHIASDGQIYTAEFPYMAGVTKIAASGHGVAVLDKTNQSVDMTILDLQMQVQYSYPLGIEMHTLEWGEDGMLYGNDMNWEVSRIHPATGQITRYSPFYVTPHLMEISGQYYGHGAYDLYIETHEGVYGMKSDENGEFPAIEPDDLKEAAELVISWGNSCLSGIRTTDIYIRDETAVYGHIYVDDSGTMSSSMLLLQVPEAELKPRELITITSYVGSVLQHYANLFNRENDRYFVQILSWDMRDVGTEEIQKKLFAEMEAGNTPDLLYCNAFMEPVYLNLAKQGYLADLTELSEGLLQGTAASVRYGDRMYRIPWAMRYDLLMTAGETKELTATSLIEEVQSLPEGQVLFSSSQFLTNRKSCFLETCVQTQFIDMENETCHFDDPVFIEYLELMRNQERYVNSSYGSLQVGAVYTMTNSALPAYIQNGTVRYVHLPLGLPGYAAFGKMLYGDVPYTYCGFPGADILISEYRSLALFENAKNPEGAKAFIRFMLSDTAQITERRWDDIMPVTETAIETLFADTLYCFQASTSPEYFWLCGSYPDAESEEYKEHLRYIYGREQDHKIVTFTEEEKNTLIALLNSENAGRIADPTLTAIIDEELGPYLEGDRSAKETADVLQKRVSIYLAE